MTACEDDAALTGPVSLFCGIETATWTDTQFTQVAQFARTHGVSSLFIKVSEVGSRAGDIWYGGLSGIDAVKVLIEAQGVKFIPFSFLWGDTELQTEIQINKALLARYGVLCLDVEGNAWAGDVAGQWAAQLASALAPIPGKLWLSHPANFDDAGQTPFMKEITACTNVYMPMAYNNYLMSRYLPQLQALNANPCIQPTLDMSQEFGANDVFANAQTCKNNGALAISLWYEGFARQDASMTALLDRIVALYRGGNPPVLTTLPDYPMVDQRNSRTYDGRYDENASMNCVPASFCSAIIYYARGAASNISADLLKDAVLGEAYLGGTSLRAFIPFVEQHYGVTATAWGNASNNTLVEHAHREIKNGRPVIFTEVDPYVDTSLPEYQGWTHVCVFFGEVTGGLKAMDPWGGKVVTKSDAAWASVLRAGEIWIVTPKGQGLMGVPNGWTDVNGVLTAPNKQIVVQGFRNTVLAGWDSTNYPMGPERWRNPLEFSNAALGEGAWQNFRYGALAYRKATSQIYTPWVGQELQWLMEHYDGLMKERDDLKAQVAALQAQIAAGGQIPAVVLDDIKAINAQIAPAMPLVNKLVKDAGL